MYIRLPEDVLDTLNTLFDGDIESFTVKWVQDEPDGHVD